MTTRLASLLEIPIRHRLFGLVALAPLAAVAAGCGGGATFETNNCGDFDTVNCVEIEGGDSAALLTAVNTLEDDTTVILGPGTFELTNTVQIRNASGVNLVGQGIDTTTLSFTGVSAQTNGIDVIGDDFLVQDLTVLDAGKDGIRVEASVGVTFRRIRATWTNEGRSSNGAYGIYPVSSQNVLVEDSFAENASDAGLYVGQCRNVVVRRNRVTGNVAGLEIENTQYADVYENHAEDNTGGIVVFDLPGNPIVGRDVRLRDNTIVRNNRRNFAPGGTVAEIPPGTGTFVMASRRVVVTNNTYEENNAVDIALISGLIIEGNPATWELDEAELVGNWDDLGLLPGATADTVMNFRSENIVVSGNTHTNPGSSYTLLLQFGQLLAALYGSDPADSVVYDTIGEPMFDATVAANNSNANRICVGGNTGGTFASFNAPAQLASPGSPFLQLDTAPFAPFDCTTLAGGDLVVWDADAP
ncbi:MAG: right-handed parallel beta-helix repeat-containing protein [Sandaracinaceae bacterium]|jgi:parallel beta-helix repeat protein|nr:right-handed parallel beta-helix repeat-containing protein [Sandaracinaceae bacterium]MBP7684162.1 right-handed parallel beta-helix repeat-containing protein [Deltaproteobacteria bacterium]MBK6810909.1 right-handed parallel beta-helix repeat-containing protein [Sandaracinaceae bacterium]MBK7151471.1 right-handed parallel beta-helix repeat-containing protein [Sandaracinaceae bacterium]MBK7776121.1 right-handed parallel beta-helix repeat-containing protein [Sandaracinaceae bacterium]